MISPFAQEEQAAECDHDAGETRQPHGGQQFKLTPLIQARIQTAVC